MSHRIYLDKIVAYPHFPRNYEDSSLPLTMPNIDASGIKTKFGPAQVDISYPGGRLTQQFKEQCRERTRVLERPRLKLEKKEKGFNMAHRSFMDNILCDIEDAQKVTVARTHRRLDKLKYSLRASKPNDSQTEAAADPLSMASLSHFGTSSVGFSSSMKSLKTYGTTTTTRERRPYSRMSLFNSLLETAEPPPKDKRRFAQIGSRSVISEFDGSLQIDSCEGSVIFEQQQGGSGGEEEVEDEEEEEEGPVEGVGLAASLNAALRSYEHSSNSNQPIAVDGDREIVDSGSGTAYYDNNEEHHYEDHFDGNGDGGGADNSTDGVV